MKSEKKLVIYICLDILVIIIAVFLGIWIWKQPSKEPGALEVREENPKLFIDLNEKYQNTSCLVRTQYRIKDGKLYGTGDNSDGQLGIGKRDELGVFYGEPVLIAENVIHVDACQSSVIYLTQKGELWGIGDNLDGQLGVPKKERYGNDRYVTTPALITENVKYAAIGVGNVIMLKEDGSVYVLGWNQNGQLGPDMDERVYVRDESAVVIPYSYEPVLIMENAVYVECGLFTLAAISENGELYMWGDNSFGEIGNGKRGNGLPTISECYTSKPYLVKKNIKDVRFENSTVYATNYWDEVYVWGQNRGSKPKKEE